MTDTVEAAATRSRSASPLPPAPIDSTPGPRASALQNAYDKALEATLNKCSYDNFASCFPTSSEAVPHVMQAYHKDFVTRLDDVCKSEFTTIIEDRDVIASLNQLDHLVNDAKARREEAQKSGSVEPPVAPHTLGPAQLVNAHLSSFLLEQETALTSALTTIDGQNADLLQTLQAQQAEIEACTASLEHLIRDIEQSAILVQTGDLQQLNEDIKMIEQDNQT